MYIMMTWVPECSGTRGYPRAFPRVAAQSAVKPGWAFTGQINLRGGGYSYGFTSGDGSRILTFVLF